MVRIDLDNTYSVGLGDNICLLSALANIPDQIDLYVTNNHNTYSKLIHYKKIFNIPDDNLRILLSGVNGTFSNTGWPLNLFKEYYQPDYVNVHNHQVSVKHNKSKHVIAIAGFFENIPANGDNKWPWCKQRPLEYWAKIFLWLKSMDYEVVTVDRHFFNLEDKIDLLVNHCSAIISYEGGMAHLSHMLRVPCFLIDWKLPSPSTVLADFHCEFVHKTSNVYIVRNDDELFEWDRTQFDTHINHLKCGKTNNRLVNGEVDIVLERDSIHGNISVINKEGKTLLRAPGFFGENNVAGKFFSKYYTKF
jgi:hypothetical protein